MFAFHDIDDSKKEPVGHSPVDHPSHYTRGKYETIDIIFDIISAIDNPKTAMCIGNCVKYLSRFTLKGKPLEDLKKARWYLDKAIEIINEDDKHMHAEHLVINTLMKGKNESNNNGNVGKAE